MRRPAYLYFLFFCMAIGCVFPTQEREEQQRKIQDLEQKNKQLEDERSELVAQNKRLNALADKVLQRLGQYARIEKRLIEENSELYRKLYEERLLEQKKLEQEREKDLKQLEEEARKLLQNSAESNQQIVAALNEAKQTLFSLGAWDLEDERRLVAVTERLLRYDISPQEEQEARGEAISFKEELSQRMEQKKAQSTKEG